MVEERYREVLRNKGLKERMVRGRWERTEGSGTMEELGKMGWKRERRERWDRGGKFGDDCFR